MSLAAASFCVVIAPQDHHVNHHHCENLKSQTNDRSAIEVLWNMNP